MPTLSLIMHATYTIFIDWVHIILVYKASCKISVRSGFRKNIFDLQISSRKVHPVQILSRSDYCISTNMMWKHTKNV